MAIASAVVDAEEIGRLLTSSHCGATGQRARGIMERLLETQPESTDDQERLGLRARRIEAGDALLQTPLLKHREIACSDDFEVLEIVAPADFETRVVDGPKEQSVAAD